VLSFLPANPVDQTSASSLHDGRIAFFRPMIDSLGTYPAERDHGRIGICIPAAV
jgi:hypothetical protein